MVTRREFIVFGLQAPLLAQVGSIQGEDMLKNELGKDRRFRGEQDISIKINETNIEFVKIMPGKGIVGSKSPTFLPWHQSHPQYRSIEITKEFYIMRYPLKVANLLDMLDVGLMQGLSFNVKILESFDQELPLGVSGHMAIQICDKLSKLFGVRLMFPTEAQWEYACRAGSETNFYNGDTEDDLKRVGWYKQNAGGALKRVGLLEPNSWGLYDMLGNIVEACRDNMSRTSDVIDPVGQINQIDGFPMTVRGGSFVSPAHGCTCYYSSNANIYNNGSSSAMGLRLIIDGVYN